MLPLTRVSLGTAYYPEYQLSPNVAGDLRLMRAAGISVIRVGESVWSTWEPRDGEFDLEWLAPVLDEAAANSISVILGTPTYAVPPWLQVAHPEIAAHFATGSPVPWGSRQEIDHSHPTFRRYAERLIRAIMQRYADHPAIVGVQVDNEPGLTLLHNPGVFERFRAELQSTYGTVEVINREWGLTYWSHRLSDWSELWLPDGNTFPQYDLAWRRFQARLTTEFISWQAELVREYTRDKFVTTCIAYLRPGLKDEQVARALDVSSGNAYYGTQKHLDLAVTLGAPDTWISSGVPALIRQGDRMFSSRQARFLVTETNAQSISGSNYNQPPFPGQLKQAAFAFIARGASLIEYWHWQSLHYGFETYWGGILPHSGVPGRIYDEIAEIGAELRGLDGALDDYVPDADIAHIWSDDSRYAMDFAPPFGEAASYETIFDTFHEGALRAGLQARIIHDTQLLEMPADELARRFPVMTAAAVYVASDDLITRLRDYVAAGGHLIVGIRTAYADHEARARAEVAPPGLRDLAAIRYEEFTTLDEPVPLVSFGGFLLSERATGTRWIDGVIPEGAEVLVSYDDRFFGNFAAVTTQVSGNGRVTYVGTVPSPQLAADLFEWAKPSRVSAAYVAASGSVTVITGLTGSHRALFLHNWSSDAGTARLLQSAVDAVTGEELPPTDIPLPPWSSRLLLAALEPSREAAAPPEASSLDVATTKR